MRKILLAVAPVDAGACLNNPKAIARDVYDCYKAGACLVHLHCRDLNNNLTPDLSILKETVDYIRSMCDIVVEISTGGVSNLTIEERCTPCYPEWVEANSLNVGSVNLGDAVYQNPIKDVRYCVDKIVTNHKLPETELFEVGMANTLRELDEMFHIPKPLLIALVFGHPGEMPATVPALKHMIQGVYDNFPKDEVIWGYTEAHRTDWTMVANALDLGAGSLRIGFEDSHTISPGVDVDTNAELIVKAADVIKSKGLGLMTPDDVRKTFNLKPLGRARASF